jgi:hypothetical protein
MSYNYKDVIDTEPCSYQDKFLEYANNWEDDKEIEKKRVKIIHAPSKDEDINFEEKINAFLEKNSKEINVIDIKYQRSSVMVLYCPKDKN